MTLNFYYEHRSKNDKDLKRISKAIKEIKKVKRKI